MDAKRSGWQPAVSLDDISELMPGRSVTRAWTEGSQQRTWCEVHTVGELLTHPCVGRVEVALGMFPRFRLIISNGAYSENTGGRINETNTVFRHRQRKCETRWCHEAD